MKENWANSLKQKMAGFKQPVDDALWAGIARVSLKSRIRLWPWAITALASVAVITIVLLLQPEPAVEPIVVCPGEMVATVEESYSPVRPPQNISVRPLIETEESFPPNNGDENEKTESDRLTIPDSVTQVETAVIDESTKEDEPSEDEWAEIIAEQSAPHGNRVKITTSIYYSAGSAPTQGNQPMPPSGGDDTNQDYPPGIEDPNAGSGEQEDDNNDETKGLGQSMKTSQTQSSAAFPEWTHAFPLQIGARVSFSWSERWSMDTGLTFIHFNSWNSSTQQRMEFIGIPLYVNYKIGSGGNFTVYASAGGQAFKCFAGNAPDKPWLFSCGLGIGAEYNLSPVVSIYAEPGADRYFHTGESRHYYTDNPFAFSLSLGFRLHL